MVDEFYARRYGNEHRGIDEFGLGAVLSRRTDGHGGDDDGRLAVAHARRQAGFLVPAAGRSLEGAAVFRGDVRRADGDPPSTCCRAE